MPIRLPGQFLISFVSSLSIWLLFMMHYVLLLQREMQKLYVLKQYFVQMA